MFNNYLKICDQTTTTILDLSSKNQVTQWNEKTKFSIKKSFLFKLALTLELNWPHWINETFVVVEYSKTLDHCSIKQKF